MIDPKDASELASLCRQYHELDEAMFFVTGRMGSITRKYTSVADLRSLLDTMTRSHGGPVLRAILRDRIRQAEKEQAEKGQAEEAEPSPPQ